MRRRLVFFGLWAVTTIAATGVGLAAVGVVRAASSPVGTTQALSEQQVRSDLLQAQGAGSPAPASSAASPRPTTSSAARPTPGSGSSPSLRPSASRSTATTKPSPSATRTSSPKPTRSSTPSPTSPSTKRAVISSEGGSVVAECTGDRVYLVSWSPKDGYSVGEVRRGPAQEAELRFEKDHVRVKISVECRGGSPVGHVEVEREPEG